MNLPRDVDGLGEDLPCPLADRCLMTAIEKDLAVLSSTSASGEERLEALKYLGHWVGDLHPPMHVSLEDDRGGNRVRATGLCSRNLHAVWDGCLIEQGLGEDVRALAGELLPQVADEQRTASTASGAAARANEPFAITTAPEFEYCLQAEDGCWYETGNERLDETEPERV